MRLWGVVVAREERGWSEGASERVSECVPSFHSLLYSVLT